MKKLLLTFLVALTGVVTASAEEDTYTVVGNTGTNWTTTDGNNDMALVDGLYVKSYTDVEITAGFNIEYKIVKNHDYNVDQWPKYGNANYYVESAGVYNITYTFNPSDNSYNCYVDPVMYFVVTSGSNWVAGDKLSYYNRIYTGTIDAAANSNFDIAQSWAISNGTLNNWGGVQRPYTEDGDYAVYFNHLSVGSYQNQDSGGVFEVKETAKYSLTFNFGTKNITLEAEKTETIDSENKWATYSVGKYAVGGYIITGAKAYYVNAAESGTATLVAVADDAVIPAQTGIILKGSGDFTVKTTSEAGTALTGNMLVGSNSDEVTIPSTGYILAMGDKGLGFYPIDTEDATMLAAHKAYLNVPEGSARAFIGFGEESTGVSAVSVQQNNGVVYNLNGQRVAQPRKGLFIVDGKKVLVK